MKHLQLSYLPIILVISALFLLYGTVSVFADEPDPLIGIERTKNKEEVEITSAILNAFAPLPQEVLPSDYELSEELITLGRMLYYEKRLSINQQVSCNSCHLLDKFGVDGLPNSIGHNGARGDRNAPTVYNAALHLAQFWDGRAPTLEAQAEAPILNPIEMGMPSEESVEGVLKSIPGYRPLFEAAFPNQDEPITFEHTALAIGAFERRLMTPSRFDRFLEGNPWQLSEQEKRGLRTFNEVNCTMCHLGPAVGGSMYQKMGLVEPYETEDLGRFNVTGQESDKYVFKVPSLRNVAKTGPYLHDGSIETLDETIRIMAKYQLGEQLTDEQVADIKAFLGSLTGDIPTEYIAEPELPASASIKTFLPVFFSSASHH